MLKLLLFVLPLGLDTFAVSAALGLRRLPKRERLRISLLLSSFELAMPLVGLFVGRGLGDAVGGAADYLAVTMLIGLGVWMFVADEDAVEARIERLSGGHGLALLALGLSISLDELAIGFTIGLLNLSIWIAVALIGAQAFLVAQLGLRLGARLNERAREGAERLAGIALLGLGVLFPGRATRSLKGVTITARHAASAQRLIGEGVAAQRVPWIFTREILRQVRDPMSGGRDGTRPVMSPGGGSGGKPGSTRP